jgi:hypothetical protein
MSRPSAFVDYCVLFLNNNNKNLHHSEIVCIKYRDLSWVIKLILYVAKRLCLYSSSELPKTKHVFRLSAKIRMESKTNSV